MEKAVGYLSNQDLDPIENIKRLSEACGKLLGADLTLYHHREGSEVHLWAQWNVPPEHASLDRPHGQLWHDVIKRADNELVLVKNLLDTQYAETDSLILSAGLQTYVGKAVKHGSMCYGSFSLMFAEPWEPSTEDERLLDAFSAAAGLEENRKEALDRLLHSDFPTRDILTASPLAVSLFENGKLTWTNRAMIELFGAESEADCLGRSPRDFYPSEDEYNRVREIVYQSLPEGKLAQADAAFRRLDGSVFDGHIMTGALDQSNPRTGTVATISDISARKRAEQGLRRSEEKYKRLYEESIRQEELYRSLLNSCADAIIIYDMDGNARYVSDSFTQVFGWKREEVLGRKIPFVPDSEIELTMRQINALLSGDISRSVFETKRFARNGSVLDVRISGSRYHDHEGKPAGMLVIHTDITQNKRSEEALALSEQQLRLLSSQLLIAQENERKRVAQELHDGTGQFLNIIKFRIDSALDELQRVTPPQHLLSLQSAIPLIENAIDEVKRMSMDLRPSVLDDLGILAALRWFLREFQTTYSEIRIEKNIGIEEEDVPEPLKIVVFRLLQEAFNNIAKHSGADHVIFTLTVIDGRLTLAIRDNGVGFQQETAFAAGSPEKGFGLASMRERTELSGGLFSIRSAPGVGTEICASWASNESPSTWK